mmetsp:Transcript_110920/g.236991  ORF Transcript_110920/g.236991 Transcript_110920/m.236991 type:complete len:81 (-) Transcript_110920:463-705(-)
MSGEAHLDLCWTQMMTARADLAQHGQFLKRNSSPMMSRMSSTAGTTMAKSTKSAAPVLPPDRWSKWTNPGVDSVHEFCKW